MKLKLNWDGIGIAASLVCAIHCALLPMLLTSLPLLGIEFIHNPGFEWFMILLTLAVGVYALVHGYKKHHRSHTPIILFIIGSVFLLSKQFIPELEKFFLVIAVALIVSAHYLNYRLCHRNKCSSPHHKH